MSLRVKDNLSQKQSWGKRERGSEPTDPAVPSASALPNSFLGAPSYTFPTG